MKFFAGLVCLLLFSADGFAVNVLGIVLDRDLIALTRDEDTSWSVEERVCLLQNWQRAACGSVVKVGAKGIIVLATVWSAPVKKGDQVEIIKLDTLAKVRNFSLGINYTAVAGQVEQMFNRNYSYGVMPMIMILRKGIYDYKSVCILFTLNYYRHAMRGLWARFGLGVHIGNLSDLNDPEISKDGVTSIMANATLGYRFVVGSRYNIGLGAGFSFFPSSPMKAVTYSGIIPSFVLDFGAKF